MGPSSSLRLGEFGEEFGGHCLPSYRVASHTIAVPHHCLPPTRVPHQIPHQSAAPETTPWCPSTSRPHQRAHTAGWALAEPRLQLNILPYFYKNLKIPCATHLHAFSFPNFSLVLLKPTFWAKKLLAVACTSPPNGRILPGASSDGEC